jgi:hypothetical protein
MAGGVRQGKGGTDEAEVAARLMICVDGGAAAYWQW